MSNMRPIIMRGVMYYNNGTWLLNTYIIKSCESEEVSDQEIQALIESKVTEIERSCMSSEFQYLKFGFVFLHYGIRGIDLSIWHLGKWGKTYELYNCSWYCYGRDITSMELLDSAEPVLSQYEIKLLEKELHVCSEVLAKTETIDQVRNMYIDIWRKRKTCYTL